MTNKQKALRIISGAGGCSLGCAESYYEGRKRQNEPIILDVEIECYKQKYGKYGVIK